MQNYIKELKNRLEAESDEHRRFLIQSTLCEVELLHQQRVRAAKDMIFIKDVKSKDKDEL